VTDEPDHPHNLPEPQVHRLADGTRVSVRALVPGDRDELATRYGELSSTSRRLRFVSAPAHLSDRLLDHLFDLDYVDRHALVATLVDEPGAPSVGVARYIRSSTDTTRADAAVTVLDDHQGRGIGTLLLTSLVTVAMDNGIEVFTADVLWDNAELLDGLRAVGAQVVAGEPGLATVHVDLPPVHEGVRGSALHEVMRMAGSGAPS
jgi:GNAT superfamily N-acetyltransferase